MASSAPHGPLFRRAGWVIRGRPCGGVRLAGVASVVCGMLFAVGGCASVADATPETTTFEFVGSTLDVHSHGAATDLVAADRSDVEVTRWFDGKGATGVQLSWTLEGDTLDLRAECSGFANCDARLQVTVPRQVTVLRDGEPTDLHGTGGGAR